MAWFALFYANEQMEHRPWDSLTVVRADGGFGRKEKKNL